MPATPSPSTDVVVLRRTNAAEEWANSTDRVTLFTVEREVANDEGDGTHVERTDYTMPAKPNPGLSLQYLRLARKEGELANVWLIETAIGSDGYDALVDELAGFEGDAQALLLNLVARIQKVAMGGLETPAPKG